jgi:hypothetical protein
MTIMRSADNGDYLSRCRQCPCSPVHTSTTPSLLNSSSFATGFAIERRSYQRPHSRLIPSGAVLSESSLILRRNCHGRARVICIIATATRASNVSELRRMETRPNARGAQMVAGSSLRCLRRIASALWAVGGTRRTIRTQVHTRPMLCAPIAKVVQASLTRSQPCPKRPFGMWAHSHEELLQEKYVSSI